jgi:hypothetical protein
VYRICQDVSNVGGVELPEDYGTADGAALCSCTCHGGAAYPRESDAGSWECLIWDGSVELMAGSCCSEGYEGYGYDDGATNGSVVTFFVTTDADYDGSISEAEFVSACEADQGVDCAQSFADCDTDSSMTLDLGELAACMGWADDGYSGYGGLGDRDGVSFFGALLDVGALELRGPAARPAAKCTFGEPCVVPVEGVGLGPASRLRVVEGEHCNGTNATVEMTSESPELAANGTMALYSFGPATGVFGRVYTLCWTPDPSLGDFIVRVGSFVPQNPPAVFGEKVCTLGQE